MRGVLLGFLPPAAVITGIYLLSATPASALPEAPAIPHLDKAVHAALYALLLSSFRGWRGWHRTPAEWVPGAAAGAFLAAVGDELHQWVVPGRSPDLLDVVADTVGIALASWFWARRTGRRSP